VYRAVGLIIVLQISMFYVIMTSVIRSLFPQGRGTKVMFASGASNVVTPLHPPTLWRLVTFP